MTKKRTTKHHIIPKSRGGCNFKHNLVGKPSYIHRAWHNIFGNLYGEEVLDLLEQLSVVFGNKTVAEMKQTVRKEWMR